MTRWAFAVAEVVPLGDEPVALILPVGGIFAHQDVGRRSQWRRRAMTALAAAAIGAREDEVQFVVGPDGRRRLDGIGLFASVAHRAGWVAAVLSHGPVGIDLETDEEATKAADVILAGVDPGVDLAAWHGLAGVWAAREAVLKAQGRDLTRDHARWQFGTGSVRGGDEPTMQVDLAERGGVVAAVAYAGA